MNIGHYMPAFRNMLNGEASDTRHQCAVWALRNDHDWYQRRSPGLPIDVARNQAIRWARGEDPDQPLATPDTKLDLLLMQDADCWIDGNAGAAIYRLQQTMVEHDAAVVAAVFQCRTPTETGASRPNVFPVHPGEVYDAEKIGTGLLLINMRKLDELPLPWFKSVISEDGCSVACGEDMYFGRLCAQAGYKVTVDWTIPTFHGIELGLPNGERVREDDAGRSSQDLH